MPWLRPRPATQAGHRRHSSIVENPNTEKDQGRENSFRPLTLRLSDTDDPPFSILPQAHTEETAETRDKDLSQKPPNGPHSEPGSIPALAAPSESLGDNIAPPPVKPQRFSLLKFRHASDPQLSTTFRNTSMPAVPELPPPRIITTSPTVSQMGEPVKKRSVNAIFNRSRKVREDRRLSRFNSDQDARPATTQSVSTLPSGVHGKTTRPGLGSAKQSSKVNTSMAPPPYGDEANSSLAIPVSRLSESCRSDDSSESHGIIAHTTTTHTISTTTTFFRLPRRKKDKGPLFPLPPRTPNLESSRNSLSKTTRGRQSVSPERRPQILANSRFESQGSLHASPLSSPSQSTSALTNAPFGVPGPTILRQESTLSARSGASTPSISLAPPRLGVRGRSSTMGSLGKSAETLQDPSPSVTASGRTSTSTAGRKSFGDIFLLSHRLRHNSEPPIRNGLGVAPGAPGSKSNSLQISREPEHELVFPEREESDTPASYLERLEGAVPRGSVATIFCKNSDEFSKTCLRKYMRGFAYFGDSLDMAIRKMLMEVELPKETQQIDRLLAGFADRYHECNPGIFVSADETSIVAFSILLLHSDTHNKNNKKKMQKHDYVKNTQGPVQVAADILECFYDNICYTPFIHFEDEVAVHSHRLTAPRLKRSLIRNKSLENLRGPVDPYTLILDNKLSVLRPSLKDVMDMEDTYSCTGTMMSPDVKDLHNAFARSGILQIVSARSRPDAFSSQATMYNPAEAQAGIVSIKVAKVGLLWRKAAKRKKAKSPWQEWGAILTDSKLYFFRDLSWTRKLMAQYEAHQQKIQTTKGLVFQPPVTSFEPDALISMDDAVALTDSSYKKHKNAFTFRKHGGFEEVFLANSELDMNDWLGRLNYAATFRTAGVRMRGLIGSIGSDRQSIVRKDSQVSTVSTESQVQTAAAQVKRGKDLQTEWEIMFYRRQIIHERISDYEERLAAAQKEFEHLLRSARHLQVLLPIQAKTREAVILAAGRMSAKLKWTRIEVRRIKCHRDMLKADLEQEAVPDFPAPRSQATLKTITPQKSLRSKVDMQGWDRNDENVGKTMISPKTTSPSQSLGVPSQVSLERPSAYDASTVITPSRPVSAEAQQERVTIDSIHQSTAHKQPVDGGESGTESHTLHHQASVISSHRSMRDAEGHVKNLDGADDQDVREAGLIDVAGVPPNLKRPDSGGSDLDKVGAIPSEVANRDRGSVRRSLQRTLRESHIGHQSPTHHRSKKGRESGSSLATTEEGVKSVSGESTELKRGAGSFIVHGKKASVVTFGSEWQTMSNEDRMRLKTMTHEEGDPTDEGAVEDGTTSNASKVATSQSPVMRELGDHEADQSTPAENFYEAPTGDIENGEQLDVGKGKEKCVDTDTDGG